MTVKPETIERLQSAVPSALAMLAGMQLDLFTLLGEGPRSAAQLAEALGAAEDRLARLLFALVATGLLERRDEGFANTAEADRFLVRGRPDFQGGGHELLAQIWSAVLRTAQSLRSGAPAALHDFVDASDEEMMAMLRGMHPYAAAGARDLAARFDLSGARSLIDIGGGSGGLVLTLCETYPDLRGTLLELPRNARLAKAFMSGTAGARVTIEAGDITAAPPRGEYDIAVLRALVQVLGRAEAAKAITHAAAALRPGGALYILGSGILDDDRLGPSAAVFLNITLMNVYRSGMAYTEAEHRAWLEATGCGEIRRTVLPSGGSIIAAVKRG